MAEVVLPNRHPVACSHAAEVPMLFRQIAPYFRHGIRLEAGDTVFDVGANIGLFCAAASEWGARPLRGFAFEPAPALSGSLRANLARYAAGVRPVDCAVSNRTGEMLLHFFARATVLSTAFPGDLGSVATRNAVADQLQRLPPVLRWMAWLPRAGRRALVRLGMALFLRPSVQRCPMRTLSSVIDEHGVERIDLLKIDAERAELEVLQGIDATHWPMIRQVVMEVHDSNGRLDQVRSLLRTHGFAEPVVEQGPAMQPFGVHQLWARRPAS